MAGNIDGPSKRTKIKANKYSGVERRQRHTKLAKYENQPVIDFIPKGRKSSVNKWVKPRAAKDNHKVAKMPLKI